MKKYSFLFSSLLLFSCTLFGQSSYNADLEKVVGKYGYTLLSNGMYKVKQNEGYVLSDGKQILSLYYWDIISYPNGNMRAQTANNGYVMLNKTGKEITPVYYFISSVLKNNRIAVRLIDIPSHNEVPFGYLDGNGKIALKGMYVNQSDFNGGVAIYSFRDESNKSGWRIIDTAGRTMFETTEYEKVFPPDVLGYCKVKRRTTLDEPMIKRMYSHGVIDSKGKLLVQPIFFSITDFSSKGLAFASTKTDMIKNGLINNKGEFVLNGPVQQSGDFFFLLTDNGKRLLSADGKDISPKSYKDIIQLKDGFFLVEEDDTHKGVINNKGQLIIPMIGSSIYAAEDGFSVSTSGKRIFYDLSGVKLREE